MIKVFYFYFNKNKYYSSTPIINNFKILFNHKNIFLKNNIELIPFIEFIPQLDKNIMLIDENIPKLDEYFEIAMVNILSTLPSLKYQKIIFLGFHPKPFNIIQKYYNDIKKYANTYTILWQDDLHAYFEPPERIKKLDYADLIITPSPIYFFNQAKELLRKTSFFFYSIDTDFIKDCDVEFSERQNKILLSGCVNKNYRIRSEVHKQIANKHFEKIADYLEKPKNKEYNYENGEELPYGINYYKILGKYKGAFFGYYDFPKNFNLAKIIEILAVGCIGFFEESPLLESELGLIPYKHYIPCTKDGKLITKIKYYEYFFSEIGEKIAKNGKKYVWENFSNNNGIQNYINIFNNISKIHKI